MVIEAQWFDSKGKPMTGFIGHILGRIDSDFWFGQATVDPTTGKSVAYVPRGMWNVQLNLMAGQYHALRWRKTSGEPLSRSRRIDVRLASTTT